MSNQGNRGGGMPTPPAHQEPQVADQEPSTRASSDAEKRGNQKPAAKPVAGGIAVVAVKPGFYRNSRKAVGDKFTVPNEGVLGSWMKCIDPQAQKAHEARMAARRAKQRVVAEQDKPAK